MSSAAQTSLPVARAIPKPRSSACIDNLTSGSATGKEQELLALKPLVEKIAKYIANKIPRSVGTDDLVSAGWLGAVDAQRRHNPERNESLGVFAQHRIRGAILDYLRSLDTVSRDHRRNIKLKELQAPTEFSLDAIHPDFKYRIDIVDKQQLSPEQQVARRQQQALVDKQLKELEPRRRRLLELYYFEDKTMSEIGAVFGVNESRISHLHKEALYMLRTGDFAYRRERTFGDAPIKKPTTVFNRVKQKFQKTLVRKKFWQQVLSRGECKWQN